MNPLFRGVNITKSIGSLLALGMVLGLGATRARADEAEGYLVLPFSNLGASAALDPYMGALADLLAERLEAHPQLRPVMGAAVLPDASPPISDEEAAKIARGQGARWVIAGSIDRLADWTMRIEERLLLVDDESVREIARAQAGGAKDELQALALKTVRELLAKAARPVPPEALPALLRPMTRDPYAFYLLGKALGAIHGYGKAARDPKKIEQTLRKLVLIDPKLAEAHRLRGWFYLEQKQPQKARGEYSYALELRKDYYLPLVGLCRMYRQSGNAAQAMDFAKRALELRPADVEARYLRGELLYEQGHIDEAFVELKRVTAAAPQHLPARRTLALIHATRGAGEELAQELEGIVALDPDDIDARLDLGSAYQRIGAVDRAITAYEAVLAMRSHHVGATKFLGDLYRARGDFDRAAELYKTAMHLAPSDPRSYFLLGATFLQAGKDAKAQGVFQDAQQFKKYLPEAWNNLGAISYRKGDISSALWYLERAAQRAPQRSKVHYNLGLALSAAKQGERAVGELRTAATLDPDDPEIHYTLGVLLLRQGKLDEAAKEFRQTLSRRPDHPDALHNLALLDELGRRSGENEIVAPQLGPAEAGQGASKGDVAPPPLPPHFFGPELPPGFHPPR